MERDILAGGYEGQELSGREIFAPVVMDFLEALCDELRADATTDRWQEAAAFAFWCRKKHLVQWQKEYDDTRTRKGRGLVFHVAPSNIPLLFAYSFVWGLLAGNGNVIRISEHVRGEATVFCKVLERVLSRPEYRTLYEENIILCYGHDRTENDRWSALCDARIVWGGDEAVTELRKSPLAPGCMSLEFADRYSMAVFSLKRMAGYTEEELEQLARRFYNDTYLMDQNACSSPKLIFWLRDDEDGKNLANHATNEKQAAGQLIEINESSKKTKQSDAMKTDFNKEEESMTRWWDAVCQAASRYELDFRRADEKYEELSLVTMEMPELEDIRHYGNLLYRCRLRSCERAPEEYAARFGVFFEVMVDNLRDVAKCCTRKVQTIVCDGVSVSDLKEALLHSEAKGGDRIVPVGSALELSRIWDGTDVLSCLSREITG